MTQLRPDSEAVTARWNALALEARRRRLAIEIRDGTSTLPYAVSAKERSGVDVEVGAFAKLDDAMVAAEKWILDRPVPGPVALRDELREHGRRLALLTARDVVKPNGADFPIYRRFRDRILPLAWDNLVDATRMEAIEGASRDLIAAVDAAQGKKKGAGVLSSGDLGVAIATIRGLVEPKEATDG